MRNIKILLAVAALLLPAYLQAGGDKDERPAVSYVQADSISLEDIFFSRLLNDYMGNDSSMRSKPVVLTPKERRKLVSDSAEWKRDIAWRLTLWGTTPTASARENFYTAARMFLIEPRYEYADIMERTLYNGVLAGLDSSESADVRRDAAQTVLDAIGTTYATSGSDVYVNLYYRNTAYVRNDSVDMVILQNTSSPWRADVFFSMNFGKDEQYMRLHLRLPGWLRDEVIPGGQYGYEKTREFYQIQVNGKLSLVRAKNGYITIDRVWKNNDVVRMVMATPIRRITRSDGLGKGKFALQYGPIVYGYCSDDANAFFRASDPIAPHYDKDVLHTNMLIAKIYNSRTPGDETPWNCNLYPYYILPSLKGSVRSVWLNEAE